jgi:hypothetical protein
MTRFAQRDDLMMRSFACVLVVFVAVMGVWKTTWRNRLVIAGAAGLAAAVTYMAVFASLLAG